MKKIILILITFFAFSITNAQDSKGYIGVSIGAAFPGGELTSNGNDAGTGLNLGLINMGYRFSENFGATLNWGGTAFSDNTYSSVIYAVGYFAVGPMVSFPLNDKIVFDLKPQIAFTSGSYDTGDLGYGKLQLANSTGFMLGSSMNFSLAKHWAISLNLDYLSTKFAAYNDGIIQLDEAKISTVNTSLGIQYKF